MLNDVKTRDSHQQQKKRFTGRRVFYSKPMFFVLNLYLNSCPVHWQQVSPDAGVIAQVSERQKAVGVKYTNIKQRGEI
jgi:hypothetical protein